MAIGLAALGLLAFLLGCSGTFAEPQNSESAAKCSLSGTWKSGMGITIEINSVSDTGMFSGTFYVYWFLPLRPPPPYYVPGFSSPLHGIQDQGPQPTFAFTVSRSFAGPITVFVGQCLVDENGKEQLRTTWVLFEKLGSEEENRKPTWVGSSTFYCIK